MSGGEALQRVLRGLEHHGCRWHHQSGGIRAQCPAHDDQTPSLGVTHKDGKALVYCQTGCDTTDVLAAIGLTMADLFDKPPDTKTAPKLGTITATYDYEDDDGVLVYQKVRFEPKTFRVRRPDGRGGWIWGIGDAPRILYRLREVRAAIREGKTIWVVEGEKDVERLRSLGLVATCNFDGASEDGKRSKWRKEYSEVLIGAHIIIIADNDAGGFAHARSIAKSTAGKAASIQLMRGLVDRERADISDHLDAGYSLDDIIPLEPEKTVNGHRPGPVTIAENGGENEDDGPVRHIHLVPAAEVEMRRIKWLWDNRILLGGLTLLAGREGLGKSTIAVELTAQITRGELPGEMYGKPSTVIYINSEDARDYTIVPRLVAANADLSRVMFADAITPDDVTTSVVLPLDTDRLAETITESGAVMVVLDAATSAIDNRLDGDKDRHMRQALEAIARKVGERTGCAVLGIVHFGKRDSSDTGKLILGSIAWSQVARSTVAVAQNSDTGDLVITGSKANLAPGGKPSLAARIVSATVDTPEGPTSVGRVEWLGETSDDARDLLDPDTASDRGDRTEAREWLQDYLGQGQVKSSDAKRAATMAGFSERTLQRARSNLRVRITSEGYPRITYWSLPAERDSGATPSDSDARGVARARGSAFGTTTTTTPDLHKQVAQPRGTTGTTDGTTEHGHDDSHDAGTTALPAFMPVVTDVPRTPPRASVRTPAREGTTPGTPDGGGDKWVLAHLTTRPQTVGRLVADLDATPQAVEPALRRLAAAGLAQEGSQGWSLPRNRSGGS